MLEYRADQQETTVSGVLAAGSWTASPAPHIEELSAALPASLRRWRGRPVYEKAYRRLRRCSADEGGSNSAFIDA